MVSTIVGYIGAGVAALFFGSNYVPTKNYPTGDGISFVWFFSSGVLLVGICSIGYVGKAMFMPTGLIGGALWATGNLCVIPIVKTIGLGLGLLIWGSTSLLTGFFVGKFGLFGVHHQVVEHDAMNWVAIWFVMGAMSIFFFIKPTIEKRKDYEQLGDKGDIQDSVDSEEKSFFDNIPTKYKPIFGALLALVSGILYGVNMLPMTLWTQTQTDPGPLDFVLSQFIGIYVYSSAVFIIYNIIRRPPKVYPEAILPAIISGVMWGIAQCGLMSATQILGYAVGFPIGSAGPLLVSSTWSVVYFKEIRGIKNLALLSFSFALLLTGILLLALSDQKHL